ncbi:MAG: MnmC family methyltransferase [Candidatus Cloacimonadota bacterium]|nr:MnmC family methyltransferase [Candidatus Cloacimonadota bacterium]
MKKIVTTQDGSETVYNQKLDEHYHSISGAVEEAFEKYVKPLGINDGMCILDYCFGLGYNSIAAIHNHCNLQIIALEKDIEIVRTMKKMNLPASISLKYKMFSDLAEKRTVHDSDNNFIKLILGDVFETLPKLPNSFFDRVFFDPFSPSKQPEMWNLQIFKWVYEKLKPGGKLATYSCAKLVRNNMRYTGFKVYDGPKIGRKSPSTIAVKVKKTCRN